MAGRRSPPKRKADLDALEPGDSPFVRDIAGVQRRFWFNKDNVNLFVRNGAVLDAVRDDNEFAFAHHTLTIAEFHAERALHDEKKLVFVIVMVPEKFSFELDGFHQRIIDFAYDAGLVVLGNETEFFFQVYGVHGAPIDRERFVLRHGERCAWFPALTSPNTRATNFLSRRRAPSPIRPRQDKP